MGQIKSTIALDSLCPATCLTIAHQLYGFSRSKKNCMDTEISVRKNQAKRKQYRLVASCDQEMRHGLMPIDCETRLMDGASHEMI